jgi:hypothetical protein
MVRPGMAILNSTATPTYGGFVARATTLAEFENEVAAAANENAAAADWTGTQTTWKSAAVSTGLFVSVAN